MAERLKKDATRGLRLNMIVHCINNKTPYGGVTIRELAEKYDFLKGKYTGIYGRVENNYVRYFPANCARISCV